MAGRRLDVLTVRWYERREGPGPIVPRWLAAARAHLPEAVPRRFGDSEPLRGRFDHEGDAGLAAAHDRAEQLLFLAGTPPVHAASLAARPTTSWGPVAAHTLHAERGAADDRVRAFALALAGRHTLYVSASVCRDVLLDRGTLVHDRSGGEEPYLAALGEWVGLPPEPPLWCWFGPAYVPLVRRHVHAEAVAGGLLRDEGPWVPEHLRARLDEPDPVRRRAPRLPRGQRRSAWRMLFGG